MKGVSVSVLGVSLELRPERGVARTGIEHRRTDKELPAKRTPSLRSGTIVNASTIPIDANTRTTFLIIFSGGHHWKEKKNEKKEKNSNPRTHIQPSRPKRSRKIRENRDSYVVSLALAFSIHDKQKFKGKKHPLLP